MIRLCDVSSGIANIAILEVSHDSLGVVLQLSHVFAGRLT